MTEIFLDRVLIASITPYFLEKGNVWFEKNLKTILESAKTQSFFQDNILYVEKNRSFNFSYFLRRLDELGYEKVQKVTEPGEFSQLGGIVEIFPINANNAVRFDFLGNKIENIEVLDAAIKDEQKAKGLLKKRLKSQKIFSDLKGLKSEDYLVHLDHGIGKFIGINKNYYVLEYAENDKLYVPLGLERKLSRYVGFTEPRISRLGSSLWQKTKRKIKEEAEKTAKELLEIYANRQIAERPAYPPDDEFDFKIAESFFYQETPDQLEAIEEIKRDLEKTKPMDRLVCGDVGFGKTEVALRAMIKVVKSGHQAAMLCPTTILANQHYRNFKERLKDLPFGIALLSRLQPQKERAEIIEALKKGKIDIIVGTHRLLSNDISPFLFQSSGIGLLVIDDEQKFGVKQKEKIKKMRSKIDVLSLSATPIPRTLHLALSSLKDISLIQTPPLGRLPIETFVMPFSYKTVKTAIEKELSRKGQVYFLHNRIGTIEAVKKIIQKLVPQIKIGVVHSRMGEKQIIKTMEDFESNKTNVLVATTIIENGLDIPNVNTLIVEDAERFGLSQAYQIKGRVGRKLTKAFAYFFCKRKPSSKSKLRLKALKKEKELGSGYRIALKDLEIRGAGNILGKEQSGAVNQVGLNLYCQMLAQTLEKLKTS